MVGQAEGVQQFVIGAVEKDGLAFVDDDEGDRAHDGAVGARFHAGHALRIGARDEGRGDPHAEGRLQRRLEIPLVDQPQLDLGRRGTGRQAHLQAGHLAGIVVDDAHHRRAAIDAAAGDDGDADRMIEAADAAWASADAQIGAEGEREESALQLGDGEACNSAGAPAKALAGAGCLPEAAYEAVDNAIRITAAANDRFIFLIRFLIRRTPHAHQAFLRHRGDQGCRRA